MVTAIVLMNADRMQIKDVAQKLVDMHQVTEAFSVAGRYDLIEWHVSKVQRRWWTESQKRLGH